MKQIKQHSISIAEDVSGMPGLAVPLDLEEWDSISVWPWECLITG
jgi:hypothetical protein